MLDGVVTPFLAMTMLRAASLQSHDKVALIVNCEAPQGLRQSSNIYAGWRRFARNGGTRKKKPSFRGPTGAVAIQ
jgi:hypothetical protein